MQELSEATLPPSPRAEAVPDLLTQYGCGPIRFSGRTIPGLLQVLSRHGGKGPAVPVPKELVLLSEGELPNWTGEFRKKRSPSDRRPRVRISFPPPASRTTIALSRLIFETAPGKNFASGMLPRPSSPRVAFPDRVTQAAIARELFPCDQLVNREAQRHAAQDMDGLADNSIARPNHELLRPPLISYA